MRQSKENESHLRSIETLAKQIDLLKSKSNLEVDKKVSMLETKTKQEAKQLKLELEHVQEMMSFKEERIKELTQEVGRLKLVIRAETEMGKWPAPSHPPDFTSSLQHDYAGRTVVGPSLLERKYCLNT